MSQRTLRTTLLDYSELFSQLHNNAGHFQEADVLCRAAGIEADVWNSDTAESGGACRSPETKPLESR